jgi:transposase
MARSKVCTDLLGIQGWEVTAVEIEDTDVVVSVRRKAGTGIVCSGCGQPTLFVHDHHAERRVRDFPAWGRRCFLSVRVARVDCPSCGVVTERLDWLEKGCRRTIRYEKYVARLCDYMPVLDVAEIEGLDKNTVYRIDRKWLARRNEKRERRKVAQLGIDEISIRKGHKYATVFYDLERREVIGLIKTRKERAVGGFFRRWGRQNCRAVVAVCMDLWRPFLNSVHRHCPKAVVVFDKFHVFKYLSEAVEEVRRSEQAGCPKAEGRLIKGTRWLWLKSADKLKRKQKQTLKEIMEQNETLQQAYLLKEDFRDLYACSDAEEALGFLADWTNRCRESGIDAFIKLAKRINRWKTGILAYFTHRITNGVSEGINNKIKVLKRRSYGFHDHEYFFLKILNATGALPSLESLDRPQL